MDYEEWIARIERWAVFVSQREQPQKECDHLTDEFRGTMQYHIDRLLRSPRPVKHGGVPMVDCRDVEHAAKALQRLLDDAIPGEQEKGEGDV
jgi:hypothetical protein